MPNESPEESSLLGWFWYRVWGEQGFPWFELLISALAGALLVSAGALVGWLILK